MNRKRKKTCWIKYRIYKNTDDVTWMNKVHERITGYNTFSNFPAEEQFCLYHHQHYQVFYLTDV